MRTKGYLLFDIDGVIRDVTLSYRLAIQQTVKRFCEWEPTIEDIDNLKSEGFWNNDWDVSLELIKRSNKNFEKNKKIPSKDNIRQCFDNFYFGGDPNGNKDSWKGFIKNENLLVNKEFFEKINSLNISWGFVSGTEHSSAKYILEHKLGLDSPPLIAMGDAPEKPDPKGFLTLIKKLHGSSLKDINVPIGFVGDTVSDVLTIVKAKKLFPNLNLISFAVSPPHLHALDKKSQRHNYEKKLIENGANIILSSTKDVISFIQNW